MQKNQYTIRNIPEVLDRHLRKKAKESEQSLNEAVVQALFKGSGLAAKDVVYDDLDQLIGSWQEDKGFSDAVKKQDKIDKEAWL